MRNHLLLLFALLCLPLTSMGQQEKTAVESETLRYLQAMETKDWNTLISMVNPKYFLQVPKELLLQVYRQMDNQQGLQITFLEPRITSIKKELIHADTSYIPVDYSLIMQIRPAPELFDSEWEIRELFQGFQQNYQGQEVAFDRDSGLFYIDLKNTLIASSSGDQVYFLEYHAKDPFLENILPRQVLDRLKSGWN